ncbi:cysteine hydrolase family protein [Amycolatopsis sp. WGS_07]|uniref:cysteine hydrolase family protein n=1 Tax=Amycolatopsis sp. WGS_07 TaxID=3076764 RepID=UPI003872B152
MTGLRQPEVPAVADDAARAGSAGKPTALLVMDFQNDFCTEKGIGAGYRGDMARMTALAEHIGRVAGFARSRGVEVIFVQFIGDEKYQKPSWRHRDQALGKRPKCRSGTWGAEFFEVAPVPGERVFRKYAHFDAFLADGFDDYLVSRGIEHLVFTGVYSDVCIDSTARTAFQKGYFVTVLADCTTGLHLQDADIIYLMRRLYGAWVVSHDTFISAYA